MSDLAVIVPTRGRPENIVRLCRAWEDTGATATLVYSPDLDDEKLPRYEGICQPHSEMWALEHTSMAGTLNELAVHFAGGGKYEHIGFMGDDHVPRTPHWDDRVRENLSLGPGICYGNDLMQGSGLPTAVFMSAEIIRALGYMCPPGFRHLYIDNVWKHWGQAIPRRFSYMPHVVIEHMHPQANGKAEWDEGYARVNSAEMWDSDRVAYEHYLAERFDSDAEKLRAL